MKIPRAPLFLAERVISQGGGLIFTALIVRQAPPDHAANFLVAFAMAGVFQPMLSSATHPLAVRLFRKHWWDGFLPLWLALQTLACVVVLPLIWSADQPLGAVVLLQALFAPGLLMATPLIATDRYQRLALTLIGLTAAGVTSRICIYLTTGDLPLAAAFLLVEPLCGSVLFALQCRLRWPKRPISPPVRETALLIATMGATSLFWRSPVLLAAAFLSQGDVIAIALAMQIVMGLCLPANALCQSLFGPISRGSDTALGLAVWIGAAAIVGAPALIAIAGSELMMALYGEAAAGAAGYALLLAPMAGFAALWRFSHLSAGAQKSAGALITARGAALAGQALLIAVLTVEPSPSVIAIMTPVSMMISAAVAPFLIPGSRPIATRACSAAVDIALRHRGRRAAVRMLWS